MRKAAILIAGWMLAVAGSLLLFAPIPVPMAGALPLLLGCAILSSHSKPFRRRIQHLHHRWAWVSRVLERQIHRMPRIVKVMIHRTRPHALRRRAQMRAARLPSPPA
ncbi:MAG: hypothetical protein KGJ78_17290 [Alphaproteobacteria bacterium]|nr:hypothetical protein [Alphaproteobacteria bacterium]